MNRAEIVDALRGLTHKQFVELFYEAVTDRFIYDARKCSGTLTSSWPTRFAIG